MTTIFAYIDPFTGSLVFQLLAMAFMSVVVFFKRIKAFAFGFLGIKQTAESINDTQESSVIPINGNADDPQQQQTKAA